MVRNSLLKNLLALLLTPALSLVPAAGLAQPPDTGIAFSRAKHLSHGINAAIWFAQHSGGYSVDYLRSFITADDIALMAKLGFDHVRLSIDEDPIAEWQKTQGSTTPYMTELDRVVKTMVDNHLAVIIDLHPESKYKAPLNQGGASVAQFTSLWRALATHFAGSDPESVYFEIMNEPEQEDPYRWRGIESTVAAAIRAAAPYHTIIACGAHWSGLDDLLALQPIALDNVIYTFHDYEPMPFTHQGATWTGVQIQPLRGIPYPSTPDNITPKLDQEPDLASQYWLKQYGFNQWNDARIEGSVEYAAQWGKLHNLPIYCGEFGVLRSYAPPQMRAQWLHDMRVALEKNNIGWAMWDYQTNFGIVTKKDGVATPDPEIVRALGLKGVAN